MQNLNLLWNTNLIVSVALKTILMKSLLHVEVYFLALNNCFIYLLLVNRKV